MTKFDLIILSVLIANNADTQARALSVSQIDSLMEEATAASMNAESLVRLAKAKYLLERAEEAKSKGKTRDYLQSIREANELLDKPFSFDLPEINYTNTDNSSSSLPDLPEEVKTTPKEHERDNSYSDLFDEILVDRQKAREAFEEKDEQLQHEFEQTLEDLDLESAERIARAIADNETEYQRILGEQLERSQNTLNGDILSAIFEIAPELKGKAWEDITEVDKEKIRQGLEQAKLDAENAIIDEENRIQAELDALETQWNQDSYNRKLANGNKEDEAYKKAEAEFKSKKDALEKNIDAITASDSPLRQAVEAAEKQIEAWYGLTSSAEDYAEDIKEIPGLINESQERIEQSSEDLKGGLDDVFSEYQRHIDRQTKVLQEQADAYDILINKAQALADGSRSMYDSLRSVRQLQRDILKELSQNKALGEYLDEDTRKFLFNDDDYSKLSSKLNGMTKDIAGINTWYQSEINSLTEDNWYLESAITAEYERRLAMKEKEYEIARAELDLEKKKMELNNVLNEKHIRMLTKDSDGNYNWEYVHDVEETAKVVGEIADIEAEISEIRLQAQEDAIVAEQQVKAEMLGAEKAALENKIDNINEETKALSRAVEDITNPLVNFGSLVQQLNTVLGATISSLGGTVSFGGGVGGGTADFDVSDSGGGKSKYVSIPMGSTWEESREIAVEIRDEAQKNYDKFIADGNGTNVQHAQDLRWVIEKAQSRIDRIDATIDEEPRKTSGIIAEKAYDNGGIAKGKGFMFKNTDSDELVLDPVQTDLFEKFIENTKGFDIIANQMNNMINSHQLPQVPMNATTNNNKNVTIAGDIVLNNVREPQDFIHELAKHMKQYVI